MAKREFDVVVWGASGFTGQLVSEYLASQYGVNRQLRWAIAGRNRDKLEAVREDCLPKSRRNSLPILLADSDDPASLAELVARTSVVCTTVGPYARYGTPLVAACAEAGTGYCDLTGEVQWMARVIPAYQGAAQASGARIVHTCGFDSTPFDIGTWYLQQAMLQQHGVPAIHVKTRVARSRGGASGGTVASMLNLMEEAVHDPGIRDLIADPYVLYPPGTPAGLDGPDQEDARYDPDFGQWTFPFVMALVNTRVVRRSNALLGFPWGEDFRYDEAVLTGSRSLASLTAIGSRLGMLALAATPTRKLAARLLPSPGEGPSRRQRENGYYEILLHAVHPEDRTRDMRLKVTGDMDPGYGSTAKMLGEASVCLALDKPAVGGGFWTPASAMGANLQRRLAANAGLSFEFVDPHPG
ncbi:MAG: saccharopine dehydrogenase NADP-binding domain-containing protein [Halieaceae bacterium]|nr:saccharopine dehydrogenase NADP-binding domain-containing protein [Halieaceae bacterium]